MPRLARGFSISEAGMRIECTTTFLHGRERFEAGDIFTIGDEAAAYFIKSGWAKQVGAEQPASAHQGPVDLQINSGAHGQAAEGVTHG